MAKLAVLARWTEVFDFLPAPVESRIQPEASKMSMSEAEKQKHKLAPFCYFT